MKKGRPLGGLFLLPGGNENTRQKENPMPSESILQTPSLPPEICADSGRILRAQQAMQYLNISRNTFYRYIKRGIIPAPRYRGRTPFWDVVVAWRPRPDEQPGKNA